MNPEGVDAELQADLLGLRKQQDAPRLTWLRPGHAGIEDGPGPLLKRDGDAQISLDPYLFPGGSGHEELPGRQRADRLGQHLVRGPGLEEVDDRVDRGQLGDGVGTEQHRSGVDQVDHRRDQAFRNRSLAVASGRRGWTWCAHALAPLLVSVGGSGRSFKIEAATRDGVSVTHTSELPNSPRPDRPDSDCPSSAAGSARSGGGNRRPGPPTPT